MINFQHLEQFNWLKPGTQCTCDGEGDQVFIIHNWINTDYVLLLNLDHTEHGIESAAKLHKIGKK